MLALSHNILNTYNNGIGNGPAGAALISGNLSGAGAGTINILNNA